MMGYYRTAAALKAYESIYHYEYIHTICNISVCYIIFIFCCSSRFQVLAPRAPIKYDDYFWEGRMLVTVDEPDGPGIVVPAIIEFDSVDGMTSFTIGMSRNNEEPISITMAAYN